MAKRNSGTLKFTYGKQPNGSFCFILKNPPKGYLTDQNMYLLSKSISRAICQCYAESCGLTLIDAIDKTDQQAEIEDLFIEKH